MDDILDIELIVNSKRYAIVYKFSFIMFIIILVTLYIIFTFHYQTYYYFKGRFIDNEIELTIPLEDMKNIQVNNKLTIDDKIYYYQITRISKEIYIDDNYQNYCFVYLKVQNLTNIDNYVYDIKIAKENKALVEYLKNYL